MKDEINDTIKKMADGNEYMEKVLTLFAARVVSLVGKRVTRVLGEELLDTTSDLMAQYDKGSK